MFTPYTKFKIWLSIVCLISLFYSQNTLAQTYAHAGEYLSAIDEEHNTITDDLWSYIKTSAHSRNARKIEKRRQQLITTTEEVRRKISRLPGYEGDESYRNTVCDYLKLNNLVLKEEYDKILDLEAIAEESYDLMEAYLLAKEKASAKLDSAHELLVAEQKVFASNHNVRLIDSDEQSKTGSKIEQASQAIKYYNKIYLVLFKTLKQEAYVIEAMNQKDINSLEQNNSTMSKYAEEGMKSLDTIPSYKGDASLKVSCRKLLLFYKNESETSVPNKIDFFLDEERFEKMKTAFDKKKKSDITQEDVDKYNAMVKKINNSVKTTNADNTKTNNKRSQLLENWEKIAQAFMDRHVP